MQNSCLEVLLIFPHTTGWPSAGATISKTWTFEVPKFSQSFSPLPFRWVLPAGLGPWGHIFPRRNTAALRSVQRPRVGRAAAHRGQGGRGCDGQERPWPRTKDLGRENLLEAMGSSRDEVDEMLICCGNCFYKCFDGVPG